MIETHFISLNIILMIGIILIYMHMTNPNKNNDNHKEKKYKYLDMEQQMNNDIYLLFLSPTEQFHCAKNSLYCTYSSLPPLAPNPHHLCSSAFSRMSYSCLTVYRLSNWLLLLNNMLSRFCYIFSRLGSSIPSFLNNIQYGTI